MDLARPDWDARLRSAGLRSTAQRRAVLQALFEAGHATVDELAAEVQRTMPDVSLSTIYRTLEVLDEAGLVTHAHLHHGSPTYHSVDEEPHVHLVCTGCGGIGQQPISVAASLAAQVQESTGFVVDVTHLALHGLCASCLGSDAADDARLRGRSGAPAALAHP
jgi:Fur family ferric uptake transcriptional regulator